MVSMADPVPVVHTFVFIDETGGSHHIEAQNVTDAWVKLSFLEEAEVEELVERGWRVKFR